MSAQKRLEKKELARKKKNRKLHDFLLFLHTNLAPVRKVLLAGGKLNWKIRLLILAFDAVVHVMFTKRERENMPDATSTTDTKS